MSACPWKLLIYNRYDDFLKLEKKEKLQGFILSRESRRRTLGKPELLWSVVRTKSIQPTIPPDDSWLMPGAAGRGCSNTCKVDRRRVICTPNRASSWSLTVEMHSNLKHIHVSCTSRHLMVANQLTKACVTTDYRV